VPSWRAVSVPAESSDAKGKGLDFLQCPHGGQSPCRAFHASHIGRLQVHLQCPHGGQSPCRCSPTRRVATTRPSCSALMAGSLRAGPRARRASRSICQPCSALMAGSLRAGGRCGVVRLSVMDLAVPSWRAVSVPVLLVLMMVRRVSFLQCPHGGQSPCRARRSAGNVCSTPFLQCPHGGQSPCRNSPSPDALLSKPPCSALMAGSLRAGTRHSAARHSRGDLAVPSWRAVSVPD